ncbi:MAG TPA: hypothetical protein VKB24_11170 [Candidatus Acidoferrum sp.]|nr:hypothetical protein [Candidatus Acidoferrum sp.]
MLPSELKPEKFSSYPPLARKLATDNIAILRKLPLSFLPNLLRELIEYDYKFPAERYAMDREIANLSSLSPAQWTEWLGGFESVEVSPALEKLDWVNFPAQFVEQLSAHLWTTHQQDAFRKAATEYGNRFYAAAPPRDPPVARLGMAVVGRGCAATEYPLFRRLRAHGAYYTRVNPAGGLETLLEFAALRAKSHPLPYAHWYVDGGEPAAYDPALVCVSYDALEPARNLLLDKMQKHSGAPGNGPENLRTVMAAMRPSDLRLDKAIPDPVLARFEMKLLTEGSGTQIFSTTFAQWAAREVLRRAEPLTLLVRFAPRQRQRPMNELLSVSTQKVEYDPEGSLVDGDMGAYYNWINQQRLAGADRSSFIAWFENQNQAIAIGPAVPRGTVSSAPTDLGKILAWAV